MKLISVSITEDKILLFFTSYMRILNKKTLNTIRLIIR